jgi:hypothetical protein
MEKLGDGSSPTTAHVAPTATPTNPTNALVCCTNQPDKLSVSPVAASVNPTKRSWSPTVAPTSPTRNAPVSPTAAPVAPTVAPVALMAAPVQAGACGSKTTDAVLAKITTYTYPEETTWKVLKGSTEVKTSQAHTEWETTFTDSFCLDKGSSYMFQINDVYGDGFENPGKYELILDGSLVASGVAFGFSASHPFGEKYPSRISGPPLRK